ncbi:MAG: hypothetical protein SOT36_09730 [Hominisplanchenecus sp.]|nr:hypothetical protein [Hominisplanchenecus sp.]
MNQKRIWAVLLVFVLLFTSIPFPDQVSAKEVTQKLAEDPEEAESEAKQPLSMELHPVVTELRRWSYENVFREYCDGLTATITYDDGSQETVALDAPDSMGNVLRFSKICQEDGESLVFDHMPEAGTYRIECRCGTLTASYALEILDNGDGMQKLDTEDSCQTADEEGACFYRYTADISTVLQIFLWEDAVHIFEQDTGKPVYNHYENGCHSFYAESGKSYVICQYNDSKAKEEMELYVHFQPAPVSFQCLNEESFYRIPANLSYSSYPVFLKTSYADGSVRFYHYDFSGDRIIRSDDCNYSMTLAFLRDNGEEASMYQVEEGDYELYLACDYLYYEPPYVPTSLDEVENGEDNEGRKTEVYDDGIGWIISIPVQAVDKDSPIWNICADTEIIQGEGVQFYRFPVPEDGTYAFLSGNTGTAEGWVHFWTGDKKSGEGGRR